ncbi:MAG: hypothetical protein H6822_01270 [Planctomycetaceae bacterium]|nr:hypothetical protein [Planctomycetales bacterium]MCB9920776.1 hypothetical protein [Planctomycetaceae bacterium]
MAQVPNTDQRSEDIPTPPTVPTDCPTLEQLGYRTKPLEELSLHVGLDGVQLPADCSTGLFQSTAPSSDLRIWYASEINWAASDLFAQPAYFDDPVLERYGQTSPALLQPWLSGVHFFGQFPLMPYKILVDRPFEKIYSLGYYRPGSPMPCVARRLPRP